MNSVERSLADATLPMSRKGWGRTSLYRRYAIALIWVTMLLRFVDLQIISVLLESIRKEFGATDTQLGLLSGFAFSILYATLGIPVGWLADRYDRRTIIACAVGLWSVMTALCGLATSFTWLLLARVGVGVGEAGGTAPAYSLVSETVAPERRASVFAILNSAVPAGVFVGFLIGGWAAQSYGWRGAFLALGVVGVLAAGVVRVTLSDPAHGRGGASETHASIPILETLRHLLRIRSYCHLVLASSLFTAGAMGSGVWIASFFIRVHHMPPGEVGTWLALIYGGGGIAGVLCGGFCADKVVARTGDTRWYAWLAAAMSAAILPFAPFVYLSGAPVQALLVQIGTTFLMHAWMGPVYGTIQSLAGPGRRALAAAINLLAINLIAYGSGPLLVGVASDRLAPVVADQSLRYAILGVVLVTYSWAALHFYIAGRSLREDLAKAQVRSAPHACR